MSKNKIKFNNISIDEDKVNPFCYEKFEDKFLITNDFGYYYFLKTEDFKKFIKGELDEDSELYSELREKGFIKDLSKLDKLNQRYVKKKSFLKRGPSLHIVEVTLRCNYNCIYCQASSESMDKEELDMDVETARKVVDRAFETTSDSITIEFQGGEPLVNWEVVKFIVEYARGKEKNYNKDLRFALVSNFSLMDQEKFDFFIKNGVNLCTSLDGPEELNNKNRPYSKGNSYKEAVKWIKKYRKEKEKNKNMGNIGSLVTVSRYSLDKPKEIIEEYRSLGFQDIHLRPLSYLGHSGGENRKKIGYSTEEFMDFWKEAMEYILKLNKEGEYFSERGARIMLTKILTDRDPGFTDLSSPCGAVIGQVVYGYNGDLYTCDEGRMIDEDVFKLGSIENTSYEEMINSDTCKTMINASTLENQSCDMCVFKPYCGVCPVKNYALQGTLFPQMPNTDWCKLKKGQLSYLFEKLQDNKNKEIFKNWVTNN